MSLTVTSNLVTINNCDVDNWDGSWGTLEEVFMKEGVGCIGIDCDIETERGWYTITQADWTGRHFYAWLMDMTAPSLDTKANGGIQLCLCDVSGNEGYWYVAGKDTYSGGWKRFVISADSTPDANNGSNPNKTQITKIGVAFKQLAKSKLALNCFWDYCQYDTSASRGIKITDGASTPRDWDELLAKDEAATIGLIRKEGGVFYLQGTKQFGDTSSGDITFEDTNQVLVYEDANVSSDFHKIKVVGNAGGTTSFKLGSKSGTAGIQGCVLKSVGDAKYNVDATDTDIDTLGLYGCTFLDAGDVSLPPSTSNREILSCSFSECGEILADTCKIQHSTVVSSDDYALKLDSTSHDVSDSSFITCVSGIRITTSGTYTFDNLKFSGCTYDISNDSGGDLTIQCTNGANASSYINLQGGSVTIENAVTLTLTNLITNSEVRIYSAGTTTELDGIENCGTTFPYTYNYAADTYVDIVVHHLGYEYYRVENYLLASTAVSLPIAQRKDRWYSNP